MSTDTIQYDTYDPDLHGDLPVEPPSKGLALFLTLIVVTAPFLVWWLLT